MLQDDLEAHLRAFPTAPFLFVGSGMTLRYLGSENWEDLLRVFASKTAKPYERYRSKASSRYPETATAIAKEFAGVWWDDDAYKRRRADYESETINFDSPLKIEVCEHMTEALTRLDEDGEYAAELAALKRVQVDGIITTNYDRLLETLFPDFVPFVGQSEILFSETQGIGEIYKIHGSVEKPNSLILTKEDYEDFNSRNAYLAARLLTVFVDHPVVFLGYSMSDKNVIAILQSIASGLTTDHLEKLRDRLIFIEWDRTSTDPALERSTFSIGPASIPVMRSGVADYAPVYQALAGLERNIPVRWARQMKERVFELVRTTSPVGAVRVVGIDDDKNIDDLEVVLGFGIVGQLGLRGIGRPDLLDDVLLDTGKWDATALVEEALPAILRAAKVTPVFKYLRGAELLAPDGALIEDADVAREVVDRVENHAARIAPQPDSYKRKGDQIIAEGKTFAQIVAEHDAWHAAMYVTCLPVDGLNPEELRDFILDHRTDLYESRNTSREIAWIRAVLLYDWLAYARAPEPKRKARADPAPKGKPATKTTSKPNAKPAATTKLATRRRTIRNHRPSSS